MLVGPDNGLLSSSWAASGGAHRAVEITSPDVILGPVVASFHARDVLCPAAAHLAAGMPFEKLGEEFDPSSLVSLVVRRPQIEPREDPVRGDRPQPVREHPAQRPQPSTSASRVSTGSRASPWKGSSGWVEARRGETFADFAPGEYGVDLRPARLAHNRPRQPG